ncbi:hypothetical protein HYH03_005495 [Edaphochlamys debaryana]|uniref:JmjC domain-containing protein n=1 Tax=Edaphochlamys debaryana TaxID=47281 RepID=A0A835Y4H1_9CHLO|nr:hypothetical protein HYH03_005495 [Edaphochlamys debaryana]|eukprot:KAG2496262.1 hypothetical protein HYH03_005495 [Edaphochlamys debaryana]
MAPAGHAQGAAPRNLPGHQALAMLQSASRELRELDVGSSVDRVPLSELTPMRFATEYVQRNKPVIITGAIEAWPALRLWGERYLTAHPAAELEVTVDVTPNGRGDAITAAADPATGALDRWFVTPHERRMRLPEFFRLMRETRARERRQKPGEMPREVPYMQHQNSNLTEELAALLADIAPGLPWAEEVFGGPPEATNLWIGDARSTTSFHKDHYENLYAVIRGTKVFTLLPPCDAFRMYLERCPAASYLPRCEVPPGAQWREVSPEPGRAPGAAGRHGEQGAAEEAVAAGQDEAAADERRLVAVLQDPGYEVLWSAVDTSVHDPAVRRAQPLFYGPQPGPAGAAQGGARGRGTAGAESEEGSSDGETDAWDAAGGAPLIAEVGPGDLFYLPSIWYHQVDQREGGGPSGRGGGRGQHRERRRPAGEGAAHGRGKAAGCGEEREEEEEEEEDYVIAVNFWYDMKYDNHYASFRLVERLATALGLAQEPPQRDHLGEGGE